MVAKIEEELLTFLHSLKGVSKNNKPEFIKTIQAVENASIPDTPANKYKVSYFLGLLFFNMPELIRPENEKPLNLFSANTKLTPEIISQKPIKRT